jgi:hypothetical protein
LRTLSQSNGHLANNPITVELFFEGYTPSDAIIRRRLGAIALSFRTHQPGGFMRSAPLLLALFSFSILTLLTTACSAINYCATIPGGYPTANAEKNSAPANSATERTVININATSTAPNANANANAPVMLQAGYQTVYTTEYGPLGPVVKKAMIPVYSTAPVAGPVALSPVPSPLGVPCAPIILQNNLGIPGTIDMANGNINGFPPAQPVQPAINTPSAWFGPASSPAPYYTTQTKWY